LFALHSCYLVLFKIGLFGSCYTTTLSRSLYRHYHHILHLIWCDHEKSDDTNIEISHKSKDWKYNDQKKRKKPTRTRQTML